MNAPHNEGEIVAGGDRDCIGSVLRLFRIGSCQYCRSSSRLGNTASSVLLHVASGRSGGFCVQVVFANLK